MDEKRAAAGGVVIGSHAMGAGFAPQGALEGDPMERLSKAKALHEQGVISDTEFEEIKSKALAIL